MAAKKALSPTLFKIIAFNADFEAKIRVCQKLINKNEQIPIPSQPTNKTKKLSLTTKKNIKNVNKDNKEKNRIKLESPFIYPKEKKCTDVDTVKTKPNITILKLSNLNSQSIAIEPQYNHIPKFK